MKEDIGNDLEKLRTLAACGTHGYVEAIQIVESLLRKQQLQIERLEQTPRTHIGDEFNREKRITEAVLDNIKYNVRIDNGY
jgi:hypothetical protein